MFVYNDEGIERMRWEGKVNPEEMETWQRQRRWESKWRGKTRYVGLEKVWRSKHVQEKKAREKE